MISGRCDQRGGGTLRWPPCLGRSFLLLLHLPSPVIDGNGINVALESRGATASASHCTNGGVNTFPIDGKARGLQWPNSNHTGNGPDEWWEVALAEPTKVALIAIANRIDSKFEKLEGARVVVEDERRTKLAHAPFVLTSAHSRAQPQTFELDKALCAQLARTRIVSLKA